MGKIKYFLLACFVCFCFGVICGGLYITGRRTSQAGNHVAELEELLRLERSRNQELEEALRKDGLVIDDLRRENNELRSLVGEQKPVIDRLEQYIESDKNGINEAIYLIRDLRAAYSNIGKSEYSLGGGGSG